MKRVDGYTFKVVVILSTNYPDVFDDVFVMSSLLCVCRSSAAVLAKVAALFGYGRSETEASRMQRKVLMPKQGMDVRRREPVRRFRTVDTQLTDRRSK